MYCTTCRQRDASREDVERGPLGSSKEGITGTVGDAEIGCRIARRRPNSVNTFSLGLLVLEAWASEFCGGVCGLDDDGGGMVPI